MFYRISPFPVVASKSQPSLILAAGLDPAAMQLVESVASANGWQMESLQNTWDVLERVRRQPRPDVLVLDSSQEARGLPSLRWLRKLRPNVPVVLITSGGDRDKGRWAVRIGEVELVEKPFEEQALQIAMKYFLGRTLPRDRGFAKEDVEWVSTDAFFVASSAVMRGLRSQIAAVAEVDMPVLITGESGSGREVAAQLIHKLSARSAGNFATVHCAAFPGEQLEAELFGYEGGVLNRSARSHAGKFELCDTGTIFLDDIAEMSPAVQAKLLHFLQENQISRMGNDQPIAVDVRILATSDTDIHGTSPQKRLRADLYCRLCALRINVPPLRDRTDELPLLLDCFMRQLAAQYGLPTRAFSLRVLSACQNYGWPGNLRELENFVNRYLITGDDELALKELTPPIANGNDASPARSGPHGHLRHPAGLKSLLDTVKGETEQRAIRAALEETQWNRKAAARLLKVSYRSLLYKIGQYRMSPPSPSAVDVEFGERKRPNLIQSLVRPRSH